MVDTGAAPNLIKKNQLLPNARIDPQHLLRLTGIIKGRVDTLGLVETNVHGGNRHAVIPRGPRQLSYNTGWDLRIRIPQ